MAKSARTEVGHDQKTRRWGVVAGLLALVVLLVAVVAPMLRSNSDTATTPAAGDETSAPTAVEPATPEAATPEAGASEAATPEAGASNSATPSFEVAAEAEVIADTDAPGDDLTLGLPDVDEALKVAPAALGTYVVAKPRAGIRLTDLGLEIPVYVSPFGPPRTLVDTNEVDGLSLPLNLFNLPDSGPLVLRVLAGGPDDDWIQVQAPVRPHDRYIWVRSSDFDFGFTSRRIEIDLANRGQLKVLDGDEVLLESEIVQGRDTRPTPVHVTYVQSGVEGELLSAAYGSHILSMASFSEVLGTFGRGVPSNYLHGTNQPELMGERVSSGEIRIPNEQLDAVISLTGPGTPVLMFDSSRARPGRDEVLARVPEIAKTINFNEGIGGVGHTIDAVRPHLWQRCPTLQQLDGAGLICRADEGTYETLYITAKPDAGAPLEGVQGNVIPVFDKPDGDERMLIYDNAIDRVEHPFPLVNPSRLGQPLVLRVIEGTEEDEWVRIEAPVRPQRQSVWVRSADFEFATSNRRIEIDIAARGRFTLFEDDVEIVSNLVVSGRESRPTPLTESYVDAVVDGTTLSPAYGPYVASWPTYSEALGTFGGGSLPKQGLHGTNQPELMGQQVSSGTIRLPNEIMSFVAELPGGLVGARVIVFDSSGTSREAAIARLTSRGWTPAHTVSVDQIIGTDFAVPQF